MRAKSWLILILVIALAAGGTLVFLLTFNLSAQPEPGRFETLLATKAKHWLVARSARAGVPAATPDNPGNQAMGGMDFRGSCANCHGLDGRTPSDIGGAMYPRSPDLGLPGTQRYSDAQLFWIIKNGIRLSGMPGFAKTHGDDQIWNLVHYVRSLRIQTKK
jgi:mono/diheme cytochrome c family protein